MSYTTFDYLLPAAIIPTSIITCLWILAFCVFRKLCKNRQRIFTTMLPVLLVAACSIALLGAGSVSLPYIGELVFENKSEICTDTILLDRIDTAPLFPLYYDSGSNSICRAKVLSSETTQFYVIAANGLSQGDYIEVSYLPHSKIILTWKPVSLQKYLENELSSVQSTNNEIDNHNKSEPYNETGSIIGSVLAPTLFSMGVFIYLFGGKIWQKLWERDTYSFKKIKVRMFGTISNLLWLVFCLSMCVLSAVLRNIPFFILFVSFVPLSVFQYCRLFSQKVHYTKRKLYYSLWGKTTIVRFDEIRSVKREKAFRQIGYVLQIDLNTGKRITLNHSDYVGIRKLFDTLNDYLYSKASNIEDDSRS